jgi:hypothetical protein
LFFRLKESLGNPDNAIKGKYNDGASSLPDSASWIYGFPRAHGDQATKGP